MAKQFECVVYRKDGSFVLVSSALTGRIWDGTLWVFNSMQDYQDCPNLDMVATRTNTGITDAVWLPDDNNILLATDSGELEIWNYHRLGSAVDYQASVGSHDDMALCVTCLPGDGKVVSGGADRRIIVWDINKLCEINSFKGHSDSVLSVAAHPSSESCFITTSLDATVRLWDLRKPKPASVFTACTKNVHESVSWSTCEEHMVALGSQSGQVEVFDLRETTFLFLTYHPHSRAIHRLAFSPWQPSILASISDDPSSGAWVHSLQRGTKVFASSDHKDFVRGLSWHPTQPYLLTCGWDSQVLQHVVDLEVAKSCSDVETEPTLSAVKDEGSMDVETPQVATSAANDQL